MAWVAAALRTSQLSSGVLSCTPELQDTAYDFSPMQHTLKCQLDFVIGSNRLENDASMGQCWIDMFRNPVLVAGFPIRRRKNAQLGLEMSLPIMCSLMQTRHVQSVGTIMVIKAFSAMLETTKVIGDLLVWHYSRSTRAHYLSYPKSSEDHEQTSILACFEDKRHVIGWCTESEYLAGKTN